MDPDSDEIQESYDLRDKTLLTAAIIVLAVILTMACSHLIFRWRALRRRQAALLPRGHIIFYAANNNNRALDRGLHPSVLNSLPVFLYSSEEQPPGDCAVCLSEFEVNDVVRLLPKCTHSFHVDCIGMWLHSHSTCPLCRSTIEPVVLNRTGPPAGGVLLGVRIEGGATGAGPPSPRRGALGNNDCSQSSHSSSSLLSLRRLLSATASSKTPPGETPNPAVGSSCGGCRGGGAAVLDDSMHAIRVINSD